EVKLQIYGFADAGWNHTLVKEGSQWDITSDPHSSFFVGNVNVYLDANLGQSARSLIEVRLLFEPQNERYADGSRMGLARDHADRERALRWGGISLERAWVEYNLHNLLTVRLGLFLTPYGIWNVDHGSPTVIPVGVPYIIGLNLMPEQQTGIELYGVQTFSGNLLGGYHLTLSNGRGPLDTFRDLDDNKAVGGRLYLEYSALGRLRIGGSAYYGRATDLTSAFDLAAITETIRSQYDELVFAGDVSWRIAGLIFQAELIHSQRAYTDAGRVYVTPSGSIVLQGDTAVLAGFPIDKASWGTYGLLAYELPWLNLTPYGYIEFYKWRLAIRDLLVVVGGLRWMPLPSLVFKAQLTHAEDLDPAGSAPMEPYNALQFQVAWAF
ncbi:MAG TPA: hypothetical protein VJR89_30245, partial [Polyangiales bacterium]|nr:hypothetical protein [Polyangiales bacterium]